MKNDLNASSKTLDSKALLSDEDLEGVAGGSSSNAVFANKHNENTIDSANGIGFDNEDTTPNSRFFAPLSKKSPNQPG